MAFLSDEKKLEIITKFLLDSPPGEVNDVFNDVRSLMNNPVVFQEGILTALEQYNTEQF
ncbi:11169_t:CDS:2, partial [Paraglomus brasilianum]